MSLWRRDRGFPWERHLLLCEGADSVASTSTGHMLALAREGRATCKLRPQLVSSGTGESSGIGTYLFNSNDCSDRGLEGQKDMKNV